MLGAVDYADLAAAIEPTGMIARGGFVVDATDTASIPGAPSGHPRRSVVMIGNVGGAMWGPFRAGETPGSHPLDRWTRATLQPIAEEFGASYVHPSDEPFQPFQRWAQRADDVWPSPIGLMIHPTYGLWHAYRGALLFDHEVVGLPPIGRRANPCITCADRPCLTTCPVDAFTAEGYDSDACAVHVRSGDRPTCLDDGCAARRACPVGVEFRYGPDQMRFHMEAFVGMSA
ncbi:MAG: hypothetical protein R8G01_09660 [Ilumatobacteraceae bacterium]|nr:hypothetical protein [Ilumatobacteraceae bacterium]